MKYFDKIAKRIIVDKLISTHSTIDVKSGKYLMNFRCHLNAVHFAEKNKEDKLAAVIYVDGNMPIIHFINYTKGKYYDNTLGEWTKYNYYYFIKWIDKDFFSGIDTTFRCLQKEVRGWLPWWLRLLSKYDA